MIRPSRNEAFRLDGQELTKLALLNI